MRKFKHKITGYIATETNSEKNYKVSEPKNFTIPKWIVEDSEDWEEVKDEFPKIISFRNTKNDVIFHICEDGFYTSCSLAYKIGTFNKEHFLEDALYEIYQVAVSETEIFTLGDKVEIIMNRHKYSKSTISRFELEANGCISVRVSEYCSVSLHDIKKAPEVLFVTENGVDIYEGDDYWFYWTKNPASMQYVNIPYEVINAEKLDRDSVYSPNAKFFSTKEAAEKHIDENKPIYSKKQIEDTLINTFIGTSSGIAIFAEIFKRNLGL